MYNIMLVEDEPPILEMVRDMINSRNNGFRISACAYNGRDALQQLELDVPNIIITDIRMPFVDGLELIARVNELYPGVICVILSGYSDFEYARSAVRLKVYDYLLKPIEAENLDNLLLKLQSFIDEKTLKLEEKYLESIINNQQIADKEKVDMNYSWYYVVLAFAGPLSNQIYDSISPGKDYWNEVDYIAIDESLKETGAKLWRFNGKYQNGRVFVIAGENGNDEWIKSVSNRFMDKLKAPNISINIISGHAVKKSESLGSVVKKLLGILIGKIIFAKSKVFFEDDEIPNSVFITQEVEKKFSVLVRQNSYEMFRKGFKAIVDEWSKMDYTQIEIQTLLHYLINLFHSYSVKADKFSVDYKADVNELISNSINYESLYENICCVFKNFYSHRNETAGSSLSAKDLVDRIEKYLNENYTNNITSKIFYEIFGYNEIYITNVFRNIKGISPSKYITRLRIDKAKEIMNVQPDILLKIVSEMVGYDDPLYFSRVFKELTGLSPSEYIKNNKK